MTEAFLAVEHAADRQAQLLRLVEELGGQIRVGKVPEMRPVLEGEGDGQQLGLVATVAGQCESGNTGHIDGVAAGKNVVQNVVLGAEHAGGLNVDLNAAAGQLFHLLLESGGGLAHDGIQRVDLGVDQLHMGVAGNVTGCGLGAGSGGFCRFGGSGRTGGRTAGGQTQRHAGGQ